MALGQGEIARASSSDSSATLSYGTSGYVIRDDPSAAGMQWVDTYGQMTAPGSFALGAFKNTTNQLADGETFTFDHVPFEVGLYLMSPGYNPGTNPNSVSEMYMVRGVLNGSLTGTDRSNLVATVDSVALDRGGILTGEESYFPSGTNVGRLINPSGLSFMPQTIIAAGLNGGTSYTTLVGTLAPGSILYGAVPEPTSVLIFGIVGVAGLVARGRLRTKAKAA
ncbi:MAG: PEP-CTERM sorting domain-containing protein [Isosphaeraceae bacterium]